MEIVLEYSDLALAALTTLFVVVVLVQVRTSRARISAPITALVAYFSLRIVARLDEAPQTPRLPREVLLLIEVGALLSLAYLLTQAGRIARTLRERIDRADFEAEEYERALRHYTQVVRHRVLNPLAVVKGAALTLRDISPMDDATRIKLCESIVDGAEQIEDVTLHPERRDRLEHDLDAVPQAYRRRRASDA